MVAKKKQKHLPTTLQSDSSNLCPLQPIHWLFNCLNSKYVTTQQLTLWKKAFQLFFYTWIKQFINNQAKCQTLSDSSFSNGRKFAAHLCFQVLISKSFWTVGQTTIWRQHFGLQHFSMCIFHCFPKFTAKNPNTIVWVT